MQPGTGVALTIRLLGRSDIRRLAKELELHPRKSLGQNFVHDGNTVRRITSASGVSRGDHVLEVGPGLGSLTLGLLDRGATVTAVEVDPVLAERLPQTVAEHSTSECQRLTVLTRDILTLRRADIDSEAGLPTALVANLPYNIAVPALLHVLAEFPSIRMVMVMVQAEVAERLAAEPGGKEYGVPSAKIRYFGDVRRFGLVPPTVFWPIPRGAAMAHGRRISPKGLRIGGHRVLAEAQNRAQRIRGVGRFWQRGRPAAAVCQHRPGSPW
jgi:16S rRNA (adenine1518-N6/adenine1519-N6)-dimethyltransferase